MTHDRAKFAKDFFFELMKDSQRLRAGYLAERERWLRSLAVDGREEVLFEFEMLLRGIERYFNLHNLPIGGDAVVQRDFMNELRAVRDAVNRAVKLARFLLDPPSDQKMIFRKYIESKVADDRVRRELMEQELEQGSPQESLFLIRSGFVALRGVLDGLQGLGAANYQLFRDVGQLALREIALNKYFKPFRPLEFRPEYDRLKDVRILEILKGLEHDLAKPMSMSFLALFRLLHYLRYVPPSGEKPTRRSLVILALVRSEITALAAFLEGDLSARLAKAGTEKSARALAVAAELRRENARIVRDELSSDATPSESVGRARDAFVKLCRQAIGQLAHCFDPSLDEKSLFDDPGARREQALRLRRDLFAFREIAHTAERAFAAPSTHDVKGTLAALRAFVEYFRDVAYQLLRYGDYEPFDRFSAIIAETEQVPSGPSQLARLAEDCRVFTEVLDRTFVAVSRREDLAGSPFDAKEGRQLAEKFLAGGERATA